MKKNTIYNGLDDKLNSDHLNHISQTNHALAVRQINSARIMPRTKILIMSIDIKDNT